MEKSRGQVADLIGADPKEIVFTSGATESNNISVKGLVLKNFNYYLLFFGIGTYLVFSLLLLVSRDLLLLLPKNIKQNTLLLPESSRKN